MERERRTNSGSRLPPRLLPLRRGRQVLCTLLLMRCMALVLHGAGQPDAKRGVGCSGADLARLHELRVAGQPLAVEDGASGEDGQRIVRPRHPDLARGRRAASHVGIRRRRRWGGVAIPLFPMTWTDKLLKPDHNFQPTSNLRRVRQTLTTTSNLRQLEVRELSAGPALCFPRHHHVAGRGPAARPCGRRPRHGACTRARPPPRSAPLCSEPAGRGTAARCQAAAPAATLALLPTSALPTHTTWCDTPPGGCFPRGRGSAHGREAVQTAY